jgi:DNA-binding NtrC family response regulator
MKILLIDDEIDSRESTRKFLELHDFVVEEANSGEQGINLLLTKKYDAVLLDVYMQYMGGIDCLKEIRKINKLLPVFMYTNISNEEVFRGAVKNNATDYFNTKDLTIKELNRMIEEIKI